MIVYRLQKSKLIPIAGCGLLGSFKVCIRHELETVAENGCTSYW